MLSLCAKQVCAVDVSIFGWDDSWGAGAPGVLWTRSSRMHKLPTNGEAYGRVTVFGRSSGRFMVLVILIVIVIVGPWSHDEGNTALSH